SVEVLDGRPGLCRVRGPCGNGLRIVVQGFPQRRQQSMMRLPDLVRRSAERYPDAVALGPADRPGGGSSYAQLCALMERGAAVLREAGLTPGDRVLLYLEPCPAWPVAFFSILETGLIVVPLPAETPISSAVGVAAFVGARAAIISNRTRGLAAGDGLRCIAIEQVL